MAVQKVDYGEARGGYLVDKKQGGAPLRPGLLLRELGRGVPLLRTSRSTWRRRALAKGDASRGRPYRASTGPTTPDLPSECKPAHLVRDGRRLREPCHIACERGRIEVERLHRPETARVILADGTVREPNAPYDHDDFYGEIEHF